MSSDQSASTSTNSGTQEPVDERPYASSLSIVRPIRVRVVSAGLADAVVVDFESLEHYRLGTLLAGHFWDCGLDEQTATADGNSVSIPVPAGIDADNTAAELARAINAKFRYAALASVQADRKGCFCGTCPADSYEATLDLSAVADDAERRRLANVLKEILGMEGVKIHNTNQRLHLTPTKFYAGDPAAVRRMVVRAAGAAGIEIVGEVKVDEALPDGSFSKENGIPSALAGLIGAIFGNDDSDDGSPLSFLGRLR